ncbi:precorrin-2 C(20)-methyltransferase [Butyricicoccus faecihominis]|uniref:precorrin-2 C(20)-methyltransferase n=1 Tax=Butyricicoccus faecihominis TaxID=1712515 RepID=UPI00247AD04C|nr:precorrin-2 C(20)-methyltransferase [Butyricicoccus faecihominis]MCQ5129628.1 precorrin-2 C(20)-methyltransferase [Butyricicoccus faecihominis]
MKQGILYGVGVGPGDPELLTLKAARILRQCDVIAAPRAGAGAQAALTIAAPYAAGKPVLHCDTPMTRDAETLARSHDKAADDICALLGQGKTVAFLTLGDPSVYSTYAYVHDRVRERGFAAELVPGVPSFCAAAAALGRPLCVGEEMLHIIPASHGATEQGLDLPGSKVLMKAGREILSVRDELARRGEIQNAALVERVGMEGERIVNDLSALADPTGYFSIILVRGDKA